MSKILVVLESPNKESKVQNYLGDKYLVTSSKGHIRDLDPKSLSIDIENEFAPIYKVNADKEYVINNLKRLAKKCHSVLLATDADREGESIAWHVAEILNLPCEDRQRLVFQEITKKALLKAAEEPKPLDLNMFHAQQARRIIDRLIGYKWLSPLLWKNVQNSMKKGSSLSGGRVQSVVNRLIIDREKEIKSFDSSSYFKTNGEFDKLSMDLDYKFKETKEVESFIDAIANAYFQVDTISHKKSQRKPAAPFITSTLQQEASNKWRMSPKSTMSCAQKLYENGLITYMRTDSVTISKEVLGLIKRKIIADFGEPYSKLVQYKNKSDNSQEAHEAIRPSDINKFEIKEDASLKLDSYCVKLYNLIWRRTIASQMAPAKVDTQTITVLARDVETTLPTSKHKFISKSERIEFDGFLRVYKPVSDSDNDNDNDNDDSDSEQAKNNSFKKKIIEGDKLNLMNLTSLEKYTKPPVGRFTEASLVKKLDEMGIGRPSTYSSMVSIVQDRNFAKKQDIKGIKKKVKQYQFSPVSFELSETFKEEILNGEKGKLVPTDIGGIVNTYLENNIKEAINFDFTVNLEKLLDEISTGTKPWQVVVRYIWDSFEPKFLELMSCSTLEKDKHKRVLGKDPNTGRDIYCYIAKFGPVVCLAEDLPKKIKTKFVSLKETSYNIDTITLDEAIDLVKYPYSLGKINGNEVVIKLGKHGLYFSYDGKNYSLKNRGEPETIEDVEDILTEAKEAENSDNGGLPRKITKNITIMKGKNGKPPYIMFKADLMSNDKPKFVGLGKADPLKINKEECLALINKKNTWSKKK